MVAVVVVVAVRGSMSVTVANSVVVTVWTTRRVVWAVAVEVEVTVVVGVGAVLVDGRMPMHEQADE